ncbi:MAG: T9SS type A sorting domain-containing protein, partial [Bacteroidales bacterium]|nr:T9SS type A sorting domain-containing protein [Bacteroidales bacterium]MBN2757694.1 T9SS type A sorting domain-containing protein [Bacteroidales bacterium]
SGVAQDFTSPVTYTVTAEDLSTQPWTVTVSIATGINNISNINFKVYPNPFNDEILLDGISQNCKVSIQSINGQVLIEKIITNQDNRINTQSLKSGVYIITIINDNGKRITKKMLKE